MISFLFFLAFFRLFCAFKFINLSSELSKTALNSVAIVDAPFEDIIPYLSEHIQPTDQLLFLGASTDLSLKLVKAGYGIKKTGYILVIDSDKSLIDECKSIAQADPILLEQLIAGRLKFQVANLISMPEVCKQSIFDSIVDFGALDVLLKSENGKQKMGLCIDQLQNAVRLGNILVCLSKLDKSTFCDPFESRFGWVQELDGDPGEISAWYRGKTNIQASTSNFKKYGLKMYVYTNTDNC
jgi:hypothetical protein